jgi:hypothetical protein
MYPGPPGMSVLVALPLATGRQILNRTLQWSERLAATHPQGLRLDPPRIFSGYIQRLITHIINSDLSVPPIFELLWLHIRIVHLHHHLFLFVEGIEGQPCIVVQDL